MRKIQYCCKNCRKIFFGNTDSLLCPACVKASRTNVIRQRICIDCGHTFDGGPRARRCLDCRKIKAAERNRRYKKEGSKRKIGSMDICKMCGESYSVGSGGQKYCSEACQRIALLQWQQEHKKEYNKKPEVIQARKERRNERQKVCIYCLRKFWSNKSTDLCSDYCKEQQKKLKQCEADIKRGRERDLKSYLDARQAYQEKSK